MDPIGIVVREIVVQGMVEHWEIRPVTNEIYAKLFLQRPIEPLDMGVVVRLPDPDMPVPNLPEKQTSCEVGRELQSVVRLDTS